MAFQTKLSAVAQKAAGLWLGLLLVLIIIRTKILGFLYLGVFFSPDQLIKALLGSIHDVIYISGLGAFFVAMVFLLKNVKGASVLLYRIFTVVAVLHVFIAMVNMNMVQMLGVPFNYQWMYYSDMMENTESLKAVAENFSWLFTASFFLLCIFMFLTAWATPYLLKIVSHSAKKRRKFAIASLVIAVVYITSGLYYLTVTGFSNGRLDNPVTAFVKSAFTDQEKNSNLFSVVLPDSLAAFPLPPEDYEGSHYSSPSPKIRNVILFVMESVSAEYVAGYNPKMAVTPVLEQYVSQSLVFSDIYAHSPSTNNTVVSMLASVYPMMSYKSISSETPEIEWPDISSELKKRNYRTGFFHASDNRFKKMDEFLSYRGFDTIMDYRTIPCPQGVLETEWVYLNGVDEECMVTAFTNWLGNDSLQQPFFATVWTMQTHYPYFTSGRIKEYVKGDKLFNRYLNALHHSDSLLGVIMQDLQEKGLAESTLVVVTGDHGEAFRQHGQSGHASHIYEENVKVPLIFINPVLFSGQREELVGGHIDLVPTIMDLLRLPSPEKWQGTSLFNPQRLNIAYFFSPWSEYLFGYRTPEYKVIFNANDNSTKVFDMLQDPGEQVNLADQMPEFTELSFSRLARWVQHQNKVLKGINNPETVKGSLK